MEATINPDQVQRGETDLYEVIGEDGIGYFYNHFATVVIDGNEWAHEKTFQPHEKEAADRFVDRIKARGFVDLDHWREVPKRMTYREECEAEAAGWYDMDSGKLR